MRSHRYQNFSEIAGDRTLFLSGSHQTLNTFPFLHSLIFSSTARGWD